MGIILGVRMNEDDYHPGMSSQDLRGCVCCAKGTGGQGTRGPSQIPDELQEFSWPIEVSISMSLV